MQQKGFTEEAERRRTTEKPVIKDGRRASSRCCSLPFLSSKGKERSMGKYTKEQAIAKVVSCAEKYRDELENRKLLLVCQDKHKNITYQEFSFYGRNYLHLSGLKVKRNKENDELSASNFYFKCLNHKLSPKDVEFASDGTTCMKLDVLPALITKNLSARMMGDYNSAKPKLYTEKLAGNVKGCMGFREDASTGNYVPDTVLNEDIRNYIQNQTRVIAVFRTSPQSVVFDEITYVAKDMDLSMIQFPKEYQQVLKAINVDKNL